MHIFPPKIPQHLPLGQSESFSQRNSFVLILREKACLTVPGNPTGHAWCSAPKKKKREQMQCNDDQSSVDDYHMPSLTSSLIHSVQEY